MTDPIIDRRVARILQITVLLCADALMAGIIVVQAWGEAPAFDLLCAGAAAGAVIAAVALAAVLARSPGLGRTALLLAWLRLIGVPVAAGVVAVRSGPGAVIGLVETFALAVAMFDAIAGLAAGIAASRSTGG